VILHLRYTAKDGGSDLESAASKALDKAFPSIGKRLISLRNDFADAWEAFMDPPDSATQQTAQLDLTLDQFPLFIRQKNIQITGVQLALQIADVNGFGGALLPVAVTPPSPFTLAPPTSPPASAPAFAIPSGAGDPFGGLPSTDPASLKYTQAPLGTWALVIQGTDVQTLPAEFQTTTTAGQYRLDPRAVRDVLLLVTWSVPSG
jgi:hypothetical protein